MSDGPVSTNSDLDSIGRLTCGATVGEKSLLRTRLYQLLSLLQRLGRDVLA
jgi:hypothetical protein